MKTKLSYIIAFSLAIYLMYMKFANMELSNSELFLKVIGVR